MLKLQEALSCIVDAIENKKIQLVFNVPVGRRGKGEGGVGVAAVREYHKGG